MAAHSGLFQKIEISSKKIQILRVFYRVSLGALTNSGAMDKFSSREKKESSPYKEIIMTEGLQAWHFSIAIFAVM